MRRSPTLREEYFSWLYRQVGNQRPTRMKLCRELHDIKFRWFIENDDNRFEDGLNLRREYIEQEGLDEDHLEVKGFLKGDCTFLEMMIGLAKRMNDLSYDFNPSKDLTSKWFVEMLENLRLDNLTDNASTSYTFYTDQIELIRSVTETVMDRTYDWYGRGGLFPLKRKPPQDQSKTEIWYQLMLYLGENYG